ncbi:MAG: hypothetical protein ACK4YP_05505 [Myxococcota bacterium]
MSDLLDLADVAPLDLEKAAGALRRVRLELVADPDGAAFDRAYTLLDGFFGPRGEMEARAALARFVRERVIPFGPGLEGVYHLVAAWDGDALVGVRDCYVDIDHPRGVCVVALSHSLVVPEWRRSGLAAVLRALPVTLARRVVAERAGRALPTLVAAEMEPVDPGNRDTVVRLVAYGRSGFSVLDPTRFRYSQPEFRADAGAHTGIPLLGVVRPVGIAGDTLPVEVVAAFPRLFHGCHRQFLPAARVDPSEAHVSAHLGSAPVPLLPLPTGAANVDRLAPLVRGAVLPLYPPGLRGPDPRFGDPAAEMDAVRADWR